MYKWLNERLDLDRFNKKFLRKAFPVHPTYFFGEIALFSFIILVITGIYLLFGYEASSKLVEVGSQKLPAAYASILAINTQPLGMIIRYVHHFAAHLFLASIMLHLLRVYFSGSYKKPREINWWIGLLLLGSAIFASFSGYLLPYDAFSVTATNIGYYLASQIPWIGHSLANFVFNGAFPSPGVLPRFFAYHVVIMPLIISLLLGAHLIIMIKQKHTQPKENKKNYEGSILGIPLWPQQTTLMIFLFLITFGFLFIIASFYPVHPSQYFGPPTNSTPMVKPDWYFLWIYGLLKIIPNTFVIHLSKSAVIDPESIGGIIIPSIIMLFIVLVPILSKSNQPTYYMETPKSHPVRFAFGIAFISFFITLSVVAYQENIGLSISFSRILAFLIPVLSWIISYALAKNKKMAKG
ncbi:MAG: cytochrome b [Desulfurella sp.]|uniref:cytochrome b n=1 Tax=Desulfurella sp. TaxID=1962857 RepID=UPI003D119D3A